MKTKRAKVCAYCCKPRPKTVDHVPPKNLFAKPLPNNLITVPCCEDCRKTQSIDDEYFRVAVVSTHNCSERPQTRAALDAVFRSFRRVEQAGFATLIYESLTEVDLKTEGGLSLGRAGALRIKKERIDRVGERIIRGLFYHELGRPVPPNYRVKNILSQEGFEDANRILCQFSFPHWRVLGDDVFRYTFRATAEDPHCTVWLQMFYGGLPFLGVTTSPNLDEAFAASR